MLLQTIIIGSTLSRDSRIGNNGESSSRSKGRPKGLSGRLGQQHETEQVGGRRIRGRQTPLAGVIRNLGEDILHGYKFYRNRSIFQKNWWVIYVSREICTLRKESIPGEKESFWRTVQPQEEKRDDAQYCDTTYQCRVRLQEEFEDYCRAVKKARELMRQKKGGHDKHTRLTTPFKTSNVAVQRGGGLQGSSQGRLVCQPCIRPRP